MAGNGGGVSGRELVWETAGRLSVVVHGRHSPSSLEWEEYIHYARGNADIRRLCVLVRTFGGSPDAAQRRTMEDMVRQDYPRPVPVAMVTSSLVVRGAMKLVSLFNPSMQCFSVEQLSIAYAYLGLDAAERERAAHLLERLSARVF